MCLSARRAAKKGVVFSPSRRTAVSPSPPPLLAHTAILFPEISRYCNVVRDPEKGWHRNRRWTQPFERPASSTPVEEADDVAPAPYVRLLALYGQVYSPDTILSCHVPNRLRTGSCRCCTCNVFFRHQLSPLKSPEGHVDGSVCYFNVGTVLIVSSS